MDRTQKKCLIGVALMHGALLGAVLIGSAFRGRDEEVDSQPAIIVYNLKDFQITDAPTHGSSTVAAPPSQPVVVPQPTPPPQPQAQPVQPAPTPPAPRVREQVKPVEVETPAKPEAKAPGTKPTTAARKIDTNVVTRVASNSGATSTSPRSNSRPTSSPSIASILQNASGKIANGTAGKSTVALGDSDDSGPAALNYAQVIMGLYEKIWNPPTGLDYDDSIVHTTIVIQRSGRVSSARITEKTGITALDNSVQRALDTVHQVPAFPSDATDSERTLYIGFNHKNKRSG